MPTDPERRSICYPNRGFPAQTACHFPPVSCIAPVTWRVPMPNLRPEVRPSGWRLIRICMSLTAFTLAWLGASTSYLPPDSQREEPTAVSTVDAVVERIIDVESGGDPNAKNKRSSATGLGQFLDETWLDMIRAHRPVGQLHRSAQAPRSCADTPLGRGVQRRGKRLTSSPP